jgi:ubiquitin C-terminal hydrolase
LTGFVSHMGSDEHGHYVAFSYINDQWWLFDDANVTTVNEIAIFRDN